jgi:hypothetical protein
MPCRRATIAQENYATDQNLRQVRASILLAEEMGTLLG